jgi:hypothetical protein
MTNGTDEVKSLFESLRDLKDIQGLIDSVTHESPVLEYKTASNKFRDSEKNEIAKDVSAMANSSGGVIVYGVRTDPQVKTKPVEIVPIEVVNIETFDRVVNSQIRCEIRGIQKKLLPTSSPQVMVIYIPQSDEAPHQSLVDNKYYRRSGTESLPMEHDLVELYFSRRLSPVLNLEAAVVQSDLSIKEDGFTGAVDLSLSAQNSGKKSAKYVQVLLVLPPKEAAKVSIKSGQLSCLSQSTWPTMQFVLHQAVVHPDTSLFIGELRFWLKKDYLERIKIETTAELTSQGTLSSWLIMWDIYADEMRAKKGLTFLWVENDHTMRTLARERHLP